MNIHKLIFNVKDSHAETMAKLPTLDELYNKFTEMIDENTTKKTQFDELKVKYTIHIIYSIPYS